MLWIIPLACAGSIFLLGIAESSAAVLDIATKAADDADWETATTAAISAANGDEHPGHDLMVALTLMEVEDWEAAIPRYHASLEIDDLPHAWVGLALATLESGGSEDDGVAHLKRAIRLGEQDVAVAVAVADVYDRLGQTESAADALATAIIDQPSLAGDPSIDPGLIDAAMERAGDGGWGIAPAVDDVEPARIIARAAGADSRTLDFIEAWAGDLDALARVQDAALADPTNTGLLSTASTLSDRAGERIEADRFRQLARYGIEGVSCSGLPLEVADTCDDGMPAPSRTELHGLWAYRRDLPHQLLPSGSPCLVLNPETE